MYNMFDLLLVLVKIKCTRAAPSYDIFIAGTNKKSIMLYIIYSKSKSTCQISEMFPYLEVTKGDQRAEIPRRVFFYQWGYTVWFKTNCFK